MALKLGEGTKRSAISANFKMRFEVPGASKRALNTWVFKTLHNDCSQVGLKRLFFPAQL
jgi:hypothetical protein